MIKYLVINLTKTVNDSYSKNFKTPRKEIEEHAQNEKPPHFCGLEELINILNISPLSPLLHRFNAIFCQNTKDVFFHKSRKAITKYTWNQKGL